MNTARAAGPGSATQLLQDHGGNRDGAIVVQHFHKVTEHVYRGAAPSLEGLQSLSKFGIATVLDLRSQAEKTKAEKDEVDGLGMHYISIPMRGLGPPTKKEIEQGISVLQDPRNWPIFVHCRYGVDRTGTLIACYRVQVESWPNALAKKEAEDLGMHKLERGMKSFIIKFQPAPLPLPSTSSEEQNSTTSR